MDSFFKHHGVIHSRFLPFNRSIKLIGEDLHSGWFAIATPVVGQMCHVKEVGYWFCFPVKHLIAVKNSEWIIFIYTETLTGLFKDFFKNV